MPHGMDGYPESISSSTSRRGNLGTQPPPIDGQPPPTSLAGHLPDPYIACGHGILYNSKQARKRKFRSQRRRGSTVSDRNGVCVCVRAHTHILSLSLSLTHKHTRARIYIHSSSLFLSFSVYIIFLFLNTHTSTHARTHSLTHTHMLSEHLLFISLFLSQCPFLSLCPWISSLCIRVYFYI